MSLESFEPFETFVYGTHNFDVSEFEKDDFVSEDSTYITFSFDDDLEVTFSDTEPEKFTLLLASLQFGFAQELLYEMVPEKYGPQEEPPIYPADFEPEM